jgi:hypothetical protein
VQRFVAQENVKRFMRQLAECIGELQKSVLRLLLAAAETELASLEAHPVSPSPAATTTIR